MRQLLVSPPRSLPYFAPSHRLLAHVERKSREQPLSSPLFVFSTGSTSVFSPPISLAESWRAPISAMKFLFMTCACFSTSRPPLPLALHNLPHSASCLLCNRLQPTLVCFATGCNPLTRVSSRSESCWSAGTAAHIKAFSGATRAFTLFDEAACKDFVDSVRLGISACLARNAVAAGGNSGGGIALFEAEQPPQLPLHRANSSGRIIDDDFASISLGSVASGESSPLSPTRKLHPLFTRQCSSPCWLRFP